MNTTRLAGVSTALAAAMLFVAACGGSDDSSADSEIQGTTEPAEASADGSVENAGANNTTAASGTADLGDAAGSAGDFEPGDIEFRVVNVLDEPVDLYVRTTGLVEAFAVAEGVEPGTVTDFVAPPTNGVFLVTEAGAGDATCVSGCDHFIAELPAFEEDGSAHTVVLYTNEAGEPSAFDLWEQPGAGSIESANAMAPSDPTSGVVVVTAIALSDADFGLRLAVDGVPGCLEPFNLENILVGGNQTPAFNYDGDSVALVLHENTDRECADEPVGGPFSVDGGPGTRSHLILTGSPGDMEAAVVAMVGDEGTSGSDQRDQATSSGDRGLAIELMTAEVASNLPLDDEQAACTAELLVDAIGVDVLLVSGALVDLDTLPTEFDAPAQQAIFDAVSECDIDPELLGG